MFQGKIPNNINRITNQDDSWVVRGNNFKYPAAKEQWLNFQRFRKVEEGSGKIEEAMPKQGGTKKQDSKLIRQRL